MHKRKREKGVLVFDFFSFAAISAVLGFKHSFDADHLLAVSNFLRNPVSLPSSLGIGFSWAVGHMATAGIITIVLFMFKESFLSAVLPHFEKIAGIMLVVVGLVTLTDLFIKHHNRNSGSFCHTHPHYSIKESGGLVHEHKHFHKKMFGVGTVHGLASNDELLALFAVSLGVASLPAILAGVTVFSVGVVAGMAVFSLACSLPLLKSRSRPFQTIFSLAVGTAGFAYGGLMFFEIL